jgi:hypothetical protein
MEAAVRQLEAVQADLKSGQRWLQWGGGTAAAVLAIVATTLVGVVVLQLQRSDALSDRIASVQVDTGKTATEMEFLREDVAEIKRDTQILRSDVQRVAEALDAKLEERTELAPR